MSAGIRVKLETALRVAAALQARWGLDAESSPIVGSVRRQRPEVGDLELLAPASDAGGDGLFGRIQATMRGDGLFAEACALEGGTAVGWAVKGLEPGFLSASLVVRPFEGIELPVQIYRYTPENRGWITLMRTGPGEFGQWFLASWKRRFNIPAWQKASQDGHLRDAGGNIVPVESERAAFNLCGVQAIEPEDRDSFMARRPGGWEPAR